MNYLLVTEEQLAGQNYDYQYAERIPDGRIILPLTALKVLSNFSPEIISGERLTALIEEQEHSGLYDKKEDVPVGEQVPMEAPPVNDSINNETADTTAEEGDELWT